MMEAQERTAWAEADAEALRTENARLRKVIETQVQHLTRIEHGLTRRSAAYAAVLWNIVKVLTFHPSEVSSRSFAAHLFRFRSYALEALARDFAVDVSEIIPRSRGAGRDPDHSPTHRA